MKHSISRTWSVLLIPALAALSLAVTLWIPPSPAQITSGSISTDSILVTARDLSGETGVGDRSRVARRPETAAYAVYLRNRLATALAPWGGTAYFSPFDSGLSTAGPDSLRTTYSNIIGVIPGSRGVQAGGQFILGAHWDGTAQRDAIEDTTYNPLTALAPGADDNASGIAAILEALRVFGESGRQPEADVVIAFFDGEEQQYEYDTDAGRYLATDQFLLGSSVLADSLMQVRDAGGKDIFGFINLDMVAYNPRVDSLVVLTNLASRWLANHLVAVHADSAATGLGAGLQLTRLVKGLAFSDHAPFWSVGVDAVLLIEAAQIQTHAAGHYHLATDRVDVSYSRGGSQVAKAAEMVLAMLTAWSADALEQAPDLVLTPDDILVGRGSALDLAEVNVGDDLNLRFSVTNRGGGEDRPWSLAVTVEDADGHVLADIGQQTESGFLPAGGTRRVSFTWVPSDEAAGAVRITARLTDGAGTVRVAKRVLAVEGDASALVRGFVYPNPTREPESAMVHYELSRGGAVRLSVLDVNGRELALRDYGFDAAVPGPEVDVGESEVPLGDVLDGVALAPGLYLVRVELFAEGGETADVTVCKMAVLR